VGTVGARIKAPNGVGAGRGSPYPLGEGLRRGVPLPRKKLILDLK